MRTIKRIVLLLALTTALLAFNLPCPIHETSAYFTGYSKTDPPTGKLLKLYRCPLGHDFWSVQWNAGLLHVAPRKKVNDLAVELQHHAAVKQGSDLDMNRSILTSDQSSVARAKCVSTIAARARYRAPCSWTSEEPQVECQYSLSAVNSLSAAPLR
jgi:hypothetical protein